jgi:3-hydroxybutyryl-CoA dehydratase
VDKGKSVLDDLAVGHTTTHSRTITEADVNLFAGLSGDSNPIHMNQQYGEKTIFGGRITHGVISLGLLSAAMAKLPGLPIFLSSQAKFVKPVRIGDTITAAAEVMAIDRERGIVTLKNTCTNQRGEVVVTGEARCRIYEPPD